MAMTTFADYNQAAADILGDGFDTALSFQHKFPLCNKVNITNSTVKEGDSLVGGIAIEYAHNDNITQTVNILNGGKVSSETTIENLFPGLKLNFKGEGDLMDADMVYQHKFAILTAKASLPKVNAIELSALGGIHGFSVGAAATVSKSAEFSDAKLMMGYNPKNMDLIGSITVDDNFNSVSGTVFHTPAMVPKLTVAASCLKYGPTVTDKNSSCNVLAQYKCCDHLAVKAKVSLTHNLAGNVSKTLSLGIRHDCTSCKVSVIGCAKVNLKAEPDCLSWGVNATLG